MTGRPRGRCYVFSLTVVDRAGNVQRRYASAEVQFAPIVNCARTSCDLAQRRTVQDALVLTFSVVRPDRAAFRVIDEAARVVFEQIAFRHAEFGRRRGSGMVAIPRARRRRTGVIASNLSAGFRRALLDTVMPTLSDNRVRPSTGDYASPTAPTITTAHAAVFDVAQAQRAASAMPTGANGCARALRPAASGTAWRSLASPRSTAIPVPTCRTRYAAIGPSWNSPRAGSVRAARCPMKALRAVERQHSLRLGYCRHIHSTGRRSPRRHRH